MGYSVAVERRRITVKSRSERGAVIGKSLEKARDDEGSTAKAVTRQSAGQRERRKSRRNLLECLPPMVSGSEEEAQQFNRKRCWKWMTATKKDPKGTMTDGCRHKPVTRQPKVQKDRRKGRWNLLLLISPLAKVREEEALNVARKN